MYDSTFLPVSVPTSLPSSSERLQVAAFEPRSYVVGPGVRSVVWVAGCHRRCPGCSQPEFFSFNAGRQIRVSELWTTISKIPEIDGVCFSGGEPFEQGPALAALARLVHKADLSVVCYSGYRLHALRANRVRFGELLEEVDLLIDGEFQASLAGASRWRGSSNQELHYLTNRIPPSQDDSETREIQITIEQSAVRFSGILSPTVIRAVRSALADRGFQSDRIPPSLDSFISDAG